MRRWKVLIADDEFIIRDGIRSSVEWEKFEMEVVGEAEDGEEAVELAIEHQIDILLIDLNMPIMNGIAAMKQLKEQLPHLKMLVISGYDEFRYAQEALRLQVEDYLLKPVNPEKLQSILIVIKEKLENELGQKAYIKQVENQIQKNHTQLQERFFQDWIDGRLESEEIKEQLQFLKLPVTVPVQFMVIKLPEYHQTQMVMDETSRQLTFFAIQNIVIEIIGFDFAAVFRDKYHLLNVFLWKPITNDHILEIEAAIKTYLKVTVICHIEALNCHSLTDLHTIYDICKIQVSKQIRMSPIVKQAQDYVKEHYQNSALTLERVAEQLNVSTVYLSKMIKQELGISYVGLLTQMRLNKALHLLKTTDRTIRDISEEVGYESQHYFSTIFKKVVGVSPKEIKKLND